MLLNSRMLFRALSRHFLAGAWMLSLVVAGESRPVRADEAPVGLVRYRGIHPVWPQTGGFCYIDVPHVHNKRPTDLRTYRVLPGDENLYVGDPVAYGYDGPRHGYFGPHPLGPPAAPTAEKVFCYLRGPHFHALPPEPADAFVAKGGVYWFMGAFPPEFARDGYYRWVNDSPVMMDYRPPKVTLADAPAGYRLPDAVQVSGAAVAAATTPTKPAKPATGKSATDPAAKTAAKTLAKTLAKKGQAP